MSTIDRGSVESAKAGEWTRLISLGDMLEKMAPEDVASLGDTQEERWEALASQIRGRYDSGPPARIGRVGALLRITEPAGRASPIDEILATLVDDANPSVAIDADHATVIGLGLEAVMELQSARGLQFDRAGLHDVARDLVFALRSGRYDDVSEVAGLRNSMAACLRMPAAAEPLSDAQQAISEKLTSLSTRARTGGQTTRGLVEEGAVVIDAVADYIVDAIADAESRGEPVNFARIHQAVKRAFDEGSDEHDEEALDALAEEGAIVKLLNDAEALIGAAVTLLGAVEEPADAGELVEVGRQQMLHECLQVLAAGRAGLAAGSVGARVVSSLISRLEAMSYQDGEGDEP